MQFLTLGSRCTKPRALVSIVKGETSGDSVKEDAALKRLIDHHHFNHMAEIVMFSPRNSLPAPHTQLSNSVQTIQQTLAAFGAYLYKGPITALIDQVFVDEYWKKGRVYAVNGSRRCSAGSSICIYPPGILHLVLDRATYTSLGLEAGDPIGRVAKTGKGRAKTRADYDRYDVTLNMMDDKWKPGEKVYDRAMWCLDQSRWPAVELIICALKEDGTPRSIELSHLNLGGSRSFLLKPIQGGGAAGFMKSVEGEGLNVDELCKHFDAVVDGTDVTQEEGEEAGKEKEMSDKMGQSGSTTETKTKEGEDEEDDDEGMIAMGDDDEDDEDKDNDIDDEGGNNLLGALTGDSLSNSRDEPLNPRDHFINSLIQAERKLGLIHLDIPSRGAGQAKTTWMDCVRRKGLIPPAAIASSVVEARKAIQQGQAQYATITVWGYETSAVSWGTKKHANSQGEGANSGENGYTVLLLPDNRTIMIQHLDGSGELY